ncbi:MAG: ATP-binding cassette domain-containing protein [Actinomycetota bacterium]|nr:ATP-binding cassette domain-containing protein [Actinomycetota bacterium]
MSLEIVDVTQTFGERRALDSLNAVVPDGVLTGLVGPNGAGKTTLLRVVLGVLSPDAGSILTDGLPVTADDRRRWGYMPQERGLYAGMPVGEQVIYFGRLHGLSRAEATRRAHALLDELDLDDRWADRTDKLSGGMQQRLQMATALVHEPEVIILDEPFNGLDPVAVANLSETLRVRARSGCVVLFSSHQLDLVQDLCEVITMIDHGHTVLEGNVAQLRASSGLRQLRLHITGGSLDWVDRLHGVSVVGAEADEIRLSIAPSIDPLAVLDAARVAGQVTDFGLDLPTLSQLFFAAVAADNSAESVR